MNAPLPEPMRERWQPLRSGILNLYKFSDEVFVFEDGRLLLRGNNGTGKSRVLALQLPFLLEGELSPHRFEPDGDKAKHMEWNLLMGGKYPDRLGYTWIEFGRRTTEGPVYLTLGCGLRAAAGKSGVTHWFFITPQRVGRDFFLADKGTPLGKARLAEAIGEDSIYTTAGTYRSKVDEKLFGLGSRYQALLNLLVQLRQPQLSRKLNEEVLSDALSEALPTLPDQLLDDVAEAYRGLESDQEELDKLRGAQRASGHFLTEYRRYVQIAARMRAKALLAKDGEHRKQATALRRHQTDLTAANGELVSLQGQIKSLTSARSNYSAQEQALRDSPQMRDARSLDEASITARRLTDEATAADNEANTAEARAARASEQAATEVAKIAQAHAAAEAQAKVSLECAAAADFSATHSAALEAIELSTLVAPDGVTRANRTLEDATSKRLKGIALLEQHHVAIAAAAAELQREEAKQSAFQVQVDEATETHATRHREVEQATDTTLTAYRKWVLELQELQPTTSDTFDDDFAAWVESGEGDSPLRRTVQAGLEDAINRCARERALIGERRKAIEAQLVELKAQRDALAAFKHRPPPAPAWREPQARDGRAGAPFWALVDFEPSLDEKAQAGIEAALEAAGLLDAWVMPDGKVFPAQSGDACLVVGNTALAPTNRSLSRLLLPAANADGSVPREIATKVLALIGCESGAGEVWVDVLGRWQLGPLHGAWSKTAPQHIGATARETERQRQLAEVEATIVAQEAELMIVANNLTEVDQREKRAHLEATGSPSEQAVNEAIANLKSSVRHLAQSRIQLARAEETARSRRATWTTAVEKRDSDARDLQLGAWVQKLPELREALHQYRTELANLWSAFQQLVIARSVAATAALRAEEAGGEAVRKRSAADVAQTRSAEAQIRFETLQRNVGTTVQQLHSMLDDLATKLREAEGTLSKANEDREEWGKQAAVAEAAIAQSDELLKRVSDERMSMGNIFTHLLRSRLLAVAHDDFRGRQDETWTTSEAVAAAKQSEQLLAEVAAELHDWEKSQNSIFRHYEELKAAMLPHGYQPEGASADDVFVVTVPFQGRGCSLTELREALAEEINARQTLLDKREREVIEKYLLDEAASELQTRLGEAERWVRDANDELAKHPTSIGMSLRFVWEPLTDGGPAGLANARALLLRHSAVWSPAEREALGRFLQDRIRAVRQEREAGSWRDYLSEGLDYRRWHRFAIERKLGGNWRRLTRNTHGTGSGGEKAIALTIPQFAAAAAHYGSVPHAPRLILLDEAFVGVDRDMRRKCMAFLANYDLDVVLTSESEWGCYPTVSALAIYQFSGKPDVDAVGLTRYVWNGRRKEADYRPVTTANRESGPPTVAAQEPQLL